MPGRMISVGDFLTQEQAKRAIQIWAKHPSGGKPFIDEIVATIIEPNMTEINRKLGQENNARFLAYAVEYAMIHASQYQK